MKLPKNVKSKWLKALRSGKYKQAAGTLYNPKTKGFCCLGVLEHCMLNGEVEKNYTNLGAIGPMNEYANFPSKKFWDGIGMVASHGYEFLTHDIGKENSSYSGGVLSTLAIMNDGGKSFEEIADYIEKEIGTY